MVSYDDFEALVIVLIFGVLGLVLSMIVKNLYDSGTVVDEFITGTITITEVQAGIIVLFLIFGIVLSAVKK